MSLTRAAQAFAEALLEDDPVALYDNAPCGYLTTRPDGSIVKVNQTFLTLTGHRRGDVLARRLVDLLTAGSRIFHETHVAPLLRLEDSVREIALDLRRADGSVLPVLLNASVDRSPTGQPHLIRVAVFEATERRRYERELLHAMQTARESQHRAEAAQHRSDAMVQTLQSTLVPHGLPDVDGLRLAGRYRPAGDGSEVGGDFYDAFQAFGDCWMVLGDVSGKGVEAAVVTALVRNGTRAMVLSLLEHRREPAEIMRMLDQLLDHHETERFCTAAILRLRPRGGRWSVSYASGGHPPAVHCEPGRQPTLLTVGGGALGLGLQGSFDQVEVSLEPGQALLLYSDGVSEARGAAGLYGDDRLLRAASGSTCAEELVDTVLHDVLAFSSDLPRDDIACLAVTVEQPEEARRASGSAASEPAQDVVIPRSWFGPRAGDAAHRPLSAAPDVEAPLGGEGPPRRDNDEASR